MGYPPRDSARNSSRSALNPHNEEALSRHYMALKQYLAASLQDSQGNMRPNRARDKLLRLSVTQFMELSTDVYDELIRREDERLQRVQGVPRSLPPKQNFHPKRNQARQKLSTLPIERFRQLATDVFYELERRIPRFASGEVGRPGSAASGRAPSRGGMRPMIAPIRPPPPGVNVRGPMSPAGPNGMAPNGAGAPRPYAQTLQTNTMVPNKSTMIEDDDNEDSDEFAMDNVVGGLARGGTEVSSETQERLEAQEAEIEDLKTKLSEKEQEMEVEKTGLQQELGNLREELERKYMDAQRSNDALRQEMDQLHRDKGQDEREIRAQHDRNISDLRAQLDNAHLQVDDVHRQLETHQSENRELRSQVQDTLQRQSSNEEYERRIELLQEELSTQERITSEVREEATMLLHEMRDLSKQNDRAVEQEEKLAAHNTQLEKEIEVWRKRYAKVKAQNKGLRASHVGLSQQISSDAAGMLRKEAIISEGGLIRDVDMTRYQLAIEELLQMARSTNTKAMLDTVKDVATCVQAITSVVGTDGYPTPLSPSSDEGSRRPDAAKLKARVTGTANSLITQTKLHASAAGLSPVALLDAAASNLTAAVVELVKAVGIRASPQSELEDAETEYHQSMQQHLHESLHSLRHQQSTHNSLHQSMHNSVQQPVHPSMGSFYEHEDSYSVREDPYHGQPHDQFSPIDEDGSSSPDVNVTISPPQDAGEAPPPLGSIGRNNTFRKMNDWFGWASKSNTPEPPATPITNGSAEYDPYR